MGTMAGTITNNMTMTNTMNTMTNTMNTITNTMNTLNTVTNTVEISKGGKEVVSIGTGTPNISVVPETVGPEQREFPQQIRREPKNNGNPPKHRETRGIRVSRDTRTAGMSWHTLGGTLKAPLYSNKHNNTRTGNKGKRTWRNTVIGKKVKEAGVGIGAGVGAGVGVGDRSRGEKHRRGCKGECEYN